MSVSIKQKTNRLSRLGILFFSLIALQWSISSCSVDGSETPEITTAKLDTFTNLYAPGGVTSTGKPIPGRYVKFSFSKNDTMSSGDDWDIAFSGFNIILNGGTKVLSDGLEPERTGQGGAYHLDSLFSEVEVADPIKIKKDASNAYVMGDWYDYNNTTHIATPKTKRIWIIKTRDEKYVKMQILSMYKDAPATPTDPYALNYYTFYFYYNSSGATAIKTN